MEDELIYDAKRTIDAKITSILKLRRVVEPQLMIMMLDNIVKSGHALDSEQIHTIETLRESFINDELTITVAHFEHLLNCDWYTSNSEIQTKLLGIVRRGMGSVVDVFSYTSLEQFDEHLDSMILEQEKQFKLMRSCIRNFDYLETRGWFMRNNSIQAKLYWAVHNGFGDKINVIASDFESHLNQILKSE